MWRVKLELFQFTTFDAYIVLYSSRNLAQISCATAISGMQCSFPDLLHVFIDNIELHLELVQFEQL